jgi:hypothetical protein
MAMALKRKKLTKSEKAENYSGGGKESNCHEMKL